jgi:asparagine synthase (glutamine-hydrolysing)
MCGIAGILYNDPARPAADLTAALNAIQHRGPDDDGVYSDGPLAIGMRRLSIIDLTTGDQPMSDASGRYWIVFNGEIYNYPELRRELAAQGYPFRTTSDTEVILAGYGCWGEEVLRRLNGMFGFALWDRVERRLWLARDRLGIKPLYYMHDGSAFRFASEIKAILTDDAVPRRISHDGLANYMTYGYGIAPNTMFEGIFKLPAAHSMTVQNGEVKISRYWQIPGSDPYPLDKLDAAIEETRALLEDAIRIHMIADVPVGAFLSGGIDSATVVSQMTRLAGRVKTFSIGFDDARYNELDAARVLAKCFNSEHYEVTLTEDDLPPLLEKLAYHYDEPFADASAFPTYVVSQLAQQHVKVVLTGDGGDELFGGYKRYLAERWTPWVQAVPRPVRQVALTALNQVPQQHRWKRIMRITMQPDYPSRYAHWMMIFWPEQVGRVLSPDYAARNYDPYAEYRQRFSAGSALDTVNRAMYADLHIHMPNDYLEKVDKATMAASVEARVPFLDYRLVELAQRIPSSFKVNGKTTKSILRRAVADVLPENILNLPKHGFSVPTTRWFQSGKTSQFIRDVLTDPRAVKRGIFRPEAVQALWEGHRAGRGVYDRHLWALMMFELWAQRYLD